jgi:hypothetical protein
MMDQAVASLDQLAEQIKAGVTVAVREAHGAGLPVFEADDTAVYAVYPGGRRVAVEHVLTSPDRSDSKAA